MVKKIKYYLITKIFTDDLFKKFIGGAFWSIIGNFAVKGLSLIAGVFVAKFLGSTSFGELSIVKSNLSLFGLLASFGLGFTMTKLIGENAENKEEIGNVISATNIIIFLSALIFSILLFLLAPYISKEVYKSNQVISPLRISVFFLFFNSINVYQLGVISGLQLFKGLAKMNVILGVLSFPITLMLTYCLGLEGTLLSMIVSIVISITLNYILIQNNLKELEIKISYRGIKNHVFKIASFSLPLAIKEIVYAGGNWYTLYVLLTYAGFTEVGIFNSANQLSQMVLFLPGAILGVTLSFLSANRQEQKKYKSLIKKSLILNTIITTFVGLILAVMATLIYDFYGSTYNGGQNVLYVLVIATLPMSLISVFEQVCISSSKPKLVTWFTLIGQACIIISILILITYYPKAITLAYAYLIGYSCFVIIMFITLKRKRLF